MALSLGFYVTGLVLADHSDSGSFPVARAWLSQMGPSEVGSGRLVGPMNGCLLPRLCRFPSCWWYLVSSAFLTKTSCH